MKKLTIAGLLSAMIIMSSSYSGELTEISDSELGEIYAQGIVINGPVFDTINLNNTNVYNIDTQNMANIASITLTTPQVNLNGSVMLSGNAQQNAFMPINIVDSAVNIPINIIVVAGDNNGNIQLNQTLDAINKSSFTNYLP